MNDPVYRPFRIGGRAVTADMAVMACFVMTALVALLVWQARDAMHLDYAIDRYLRGKYVEDLSGRAASLAVQARGASDAVLWEMAGDLVTTQSPDGVNLISMYLVSDYPEPGPPRLGVFAAEQGALRWNDRSLLWRAGTEYGNGRFVGRDYIKAMRYLGNPVLMSLPSGPFDLGELLLAEDNPYRDLVKGLELIRKSAAQGYDPAIKRLQELGG